ncbi:hypothetical protein ColTof4_04493 [Colletotrichum tofieldiae]|nr:hypothetical protein ColTof3_11298 [Colletotrichum tofieldiae]GKT72070.1 hypothetical protein ColTof4_04493 [Colletotrichum tofieldiae]
MQYSDYLAAYNSPEEGAEAAFFTEDLILKSPTATLQGRDKVMALLAEAHRRVKEELRPLHVLQEGNTIMSELDAAFVAHDDDPDNFFYHFKKGEARAWRFFCLYKLRDDKICEMHLAFWPDGWEIHAF